MNRLITSDLKRLLTPADFLEEASRIAGRSDFGDDAFREPLAIAWSSLNGEARLNETGRQMFAAWVLFRLVTRLRVQALLEARPEISEVPIERPLFIVGMPRTGTTLLHNLLSLDPRSRPFTYRELRYPCTPNAGEMASESLARQEEAVPGFRAIHAMEVEGPHECEHLKLNDFDSRFFDLHAHVPTYTAWFERHDATQTYRNLRRQYQAILGRETDRRLLLKSVFHVDNFDVVLDVFPDARFIMTHRSPVEVVGSTSSMRLALRRSASDRVDVEEVGRITLDSLARGMELAMEARGAADPVRLFDLRYEQFVADPVGSIRRIYAHFGFDYSASFDRGMEEYLRANPKNKHGTHRYAVEDFGLSRASVEARFADYVDRFLS